MHFCIMVRRRPQDRDKTKESQNGAMDSKWLWGDLAYYGIGPNVRLLKGSQKFIYSPYPPPNRRASLGRPTTISL